MKTRVLAMSVLALSAVAMGGCVYREKVAPAASPPSTAVVVAPAPADRVVTYPEGRYELRGEGTTSSPYYWIWVPAGVSSIPNPPPLPRVPQTN